MAFGDGVMKGIIQEYFNDESIHLLIVIMLPTCFLPSLKLKGFLPFCSVVSKAVPFDKNPLNCQFDLRKWISLIFSLLKFC